MTELYATPRQVDSPAECLFYHTMDVPGYGTQQGFWDLRPNIGRYFGATNLRGKRVLDAGSASGFLTFEMERQGAEVVAFDLDPAMSGDVVPYERVDWRQRQSEMQPFIRQIDNSFWLAHRAYGSQARKVYGTVYDIPDGIGRVDVANYGMILLHLRDPFLALQNGLRLTTETVIVTESISGWHWPRFLLTRLMRRKFNAYAHFIPRGPLAQPPATWWQLSPDIVQAFIGVLGFEDSRVSYHWQYQTERRKRALCFTVVGRRTVPLRD